MTCDDTVVYPGRGDDTTLGVEQPRLAPVGDRVNSLQPAVDAPNRVAVGGDDQLGFEVGQSPACLDGFGGVVVKGRGKSQPPRMTGILRHVDGPVTHDQGPVRFAPERQQPRAVARLGDDGEATDRVALPQSPVD